MSWYTFSMLTKLTDYQKTLAAIAILGFVALSAWWLLTARPVTGHDAALEVEGIIAAFGTRLDDVSLLSPSAAAEMDSLYGEYVAAPLLDKWKASPESALGRLTSSPYPDRIEVGTVTRNENNTYTVLGNVIEVANEETVAVYPVAFVLGEQEGRWLITEAYKGTYTALPERRSVEGTSTCLPKKGDGPQTMECASGIATDDGTYYALDLEPLSEEETVIPEGRVRVEGTFVPVEHLSAEFWQQYDIEGIIRVTAISEVE